jgi:2'-hydroxyisoflavone reductase
VYSEPIESTISESSPVATMPDETVEEVTNETYGPLKALCEQAAERAMPGRVLQLRPGYIVGPHDPTDRFTYWPYRIAQGGEVAVPGSPEAPVQFIDVRDLTEWIVRMCEAGSTGTYNATGPASLLTMQHFLQTCKDVTHSDARFTWLSEPFITQHQLEADFPIWTPAEAVYFATVDCSKAIADGLTFRPLEDTIQATLEWNATRPEGFTGRAGISREQEAALLEEWHAASGK